MIVDTEGSREVNSHTCGKQPNTGNLTREARSAAKYRDGGCRGAMGLLKGGTRIFCFQGGLNYHIDSQFQKKSKYHTHISLKF